MIIVPNLAGGLDPVAVRATASNTMPTHQAGDLLIGCAYTPGGQGTVDLPSGWTSIHSLNSNTYSSNTGTIKTPGGWYGTRIAWKIAASSSETVSATWTSGIEYIVASTYNAVGIGGTQTKGGGLVEGYQVLSTPDVTLQGSGSALFAYANAYTGAVYTVDSGWTDLLTQNMSGLTQSLAVKTDATSGAGTTIGSFASLPNGWSVSCVAAIEVTNS